MAHFYQDEKAARAATKGTVVVDVQPEFLQPRPMANIGQEQFIVPEGYGENVPYDETMSFDIFACNMSRQKLNDNVSFDNRQKAEIRQLTRDLDYVLYFLAESSVHVQSGLPYLCTYLEK